MSCFPFTAVIGTVAVRVVAFVTFTEVAATAPKLTLVAPLINPAPVNVMTSPRIPDAGLGEVRVGAPMMVKVLSLFEAPPDVVI